MPPNATVHSEKNQLKQVAEQIRRNAEEAFRKQDYRQALNYYGSLALPDVKDCFQIGVCYQSLNNMEKAKYYLEKAYNGGWHDSECRLGNIYHQRQEWNKALTYFENVINKESNNKNALRKAAVILLYNRVYNVNAARGKEYLIRAAKEGDPKAMFNLGCCYAKFNGMNFSVFEFSRKNAVYWLRKAYQAGILIAKNKLAELGEKTS